ncbi:LysR substrate-binding domain-containing protein [Nocardiopsis sp. RV163]|uniref:LysR substrate-binding domain-containing protein n=1 Tax=Nocardiopsis sp. RV163 TaxID=1661388 RepID=UPI001F15EE2E|nr:LysR substrate-binding domain-containing protein [Nocardiopsis sp. RV163]
MLRVPLVAPGTRSNLRVLIDRVFAEHGAVPVIAADVESPGTMVRVAGSGEACAPLPPSSVEALRSTPDLMVRRVVDPVIERHTAVCAGSDCYEPRDAVPVVRHGIVRVTTRLDDRGPGRGPPVGPDRNARRPAPTGRVHARLRAPHGLSPRWRWSPAVRGRVRRSCGTRGSPTWARTRGGPGCRW